MKWRTWTGALVGLCGLPDGARVDSDQVVPHYEGGTVRPLDHGNLATIRSLVVKTTSPDLLLLWLKRTGRPTCWTSVLSSRVCVDTPECLDVTKRLDHVTWRDRRTDSADSTASRHDGLSINKGKVPYRRPREPALALPPPPAGRAQLQPPLRLPSTSNQWKYKRGSYSTQYTTQQHNPTDQ